MSLNNLSNINIPTLYLNPNVNNLRANNLQISSTTIFQGATTLQSSLNVVGITTLNNRVESITTNTPNDTIVDGDYQLQLKDTGGAPNSGGILTFSSDQGRFAGIRGCLKDGNVNPRGDINFCARLQNADTFLSNIMTVSYNGTVAIMQPSSGQAGQKLTVKDGIMLNDGGNNGNIFFCDGNHYISRSIATNNMRIQVAGGIGIKRDPGAGFDLDVNNNIRCVALTQTSDSRIKKDIEELNDNEALEKLRLVEPVKYNYIDPKRNTQNKVIGFIAQQVNEHFPDAVKIISDFAPNVLKHAKIENSCFVFDEDYNLELDKEYIVYPDENNINEYGKFKVIEKVDERTYKFDKEFENKEDCYIYGYKIDDFHTLNKDYLFALNFSATQELDKKVKQLEDRIKFLESKFNL